MSVKHWCRENGCSPKTYYLWEQEILGKVNAQRLRTTTHIADAHGACVGVAVHLTEGLHLHGADERNERVGSRIALLRQKSDEEQQHDLRQKNELLPMHSLHVFETPMNTLGHEMPSMNESTGTR